MCLSYNVAVNRNYQQVRVLQWSITDICVIYFFFLITCQYQSVLTISQNYGQ